MGFTDRTKDFLGDLIYRWVIALIKKKKKKEDGWVIVCCGTIFKEGKIFSRTFWGFSWASCFAKFKHFEAVCFPCVKISLGFVLLKFSCLEVFLCCE